MIFRGDERGVVSTETSGGSRRRLVEGGSRPRRGGLPQLIVRGRIGLSTVPEPVVIFAGSRGAQALHRTSRGRVLCWGRGAHGELGLGALRPIRCAPTLLRALSGRRVAALACGRAHVLALCDAGAHAPAALYAWGRGRDGRLGHDDYRDRHQTARAGTPDSNGRRQNVADNMFRSTPNAPTLNFFLGLSA